MRALQLQAFQSEPKIVDLAVPTPGPGQVVIKVGGAGLCHSDLHVMHEFTEGMAPWGPPFVLGHENAGWVHELGDGVRGLDVGEAVAVYGPLGCGRCGPCLAGSENLCVHGYEGPPGVGFGVDGGLAEYMLVSDSRRLVSLGDLDPVVAAPLTDAGLTPYRAIKRVQPSLAPGSHVVVIGVGGLGSLAVQILRAMTPATIIAVDAKQAALDVAASFIDHAVLAGDDTAEQVLAALGGARAEVVLDFVGAAPTIALAAGLVKARSEIVVVGAAGGTFEWGFYNLPYEVSLTTSFWGSIPELREVIALAQSGAVTPNVQRFSLDDAVHAYDLMARGELSGRAVVVP